MPGMGIAIVAPPFADNIGATSPAPPSTNELLNEDGTGIQLEDGSGNIELES